MAAQVCVTPEAQRHAAVLETGRTMLRASESLICHGEPFLVASRSEGKILELTVRRITAFAFLLSGIVGTFVAVGAAPPHIAAIVATWLAGGAAARLFVARRRREHGRVLIDLDRGSVHARTLAGDVFVVPLARFTVLTERSADESAPVWLLLSAEGSPAHRRLRLRLGRGPAEDVERVLTLLRSHHLPVRRGHDEA